MTSQISEKNKNILLFVTWKSPEKINKNRQRPIFAGKVNELKAKYAVFLKLSKIDPKNLHDCIGRTETRFLLREALTKYAISSVTTDSYFSQAILEEFLQGSWQEADTRLYSFEFES